MEKERTAIIEALKEIASAKMYGDGVFITMDVLTDALTNCYRQGVRDGRSDN